MRNRLRVIGIAIALAASVAACGQGRESSANEMFKALTLPSDITIREFPENTDGKRWEVVREFRGMNRSVIGVPKSCTERPTFFDPVLYVSYTCPDPIQAAATCLVDVAPPRGTGQTKQPDGVDILIKCGSTTGVTGTTAPVRTTPSVP